jgi:hypothetical protein
MAETSLVRNKNGVDMTVNTIKILETSGYHKLKKDKQREIDKAIDKLIYFIKTMKRFNSFIINNPTIHDAYADFYVYKHNGNRCSIRILYKYINNTTEIHLFHFKSGDRDNAKYIDVFEQYVSNYNRKICS